MIEANLQFLATNKPVRGLIFFCSALLVALMAVGFTGHYFAAGDSIALLRPQVGVLLVFSTVVLLAARARKFALLTLASATIAIGSVASGVISPADDCDDACLTLYQKNLMSQAWPRYPLTDDILASGADIVTLQEVSSHNQKYMSPLFERYPSSAICEFRPEQNVAILSALPVIEGSEFCLPGDGMVGVQIVTPTGDPLWVVSLHLRWPYPYSQFEQSKIIAQRIKELDGPVIIAGDFNMVPWASSVRRIGTAANNRNFGSILNTHSLGSWMVPMPIDNLLVPKGSTGSAELRPFMGSDHLGIKARIGLPR